MKILKHGQCEATGKNSSEFSQKFRMSNPSTNGIASRRSNLFQMESNGHSVILKNVRVNEQGIVLQNNGL